MLLAAIAAILVGAFGIFLYRQKLTQELLKPKVMTIQLSGENNSKETGTATLTEMNGKVKVSLSVTNPPRATAQPAHIHLGKCPNPGAIKYPLTSVVNGKSETILDVTFDQLKSLSPLAVNVHQSAPLISTYVSCGNLSF